MAVDILPSILSGASLLLAGAAFRFAYSMAQRVTSLETKVEPIWNVISEQAFKGLKSNPDPTHIERDRLIDKYLNGQRLLREEARFLARSFMAINEGKESGNKGLAVLGLAVLASKYSAEIEDMLKPE